MRFTGLTQLAKGLDDGAKNKVRAEIVHDLDRATWHLWHGCPYRALEKLESLIWEIEALESSEPQRKLAVKLEEFVSYLGFSYSPCQK
jgi:hypothetical protein